MSGLVRPAAGGGRVVQISPDRLPGWVNRFGARNDGLTGLTADQTGVDLIGGNGTTARIDVPFAPMTIGDLEPIEAALHHVGSIGTIGIILIRAGAHSVGVARDRSVVASSTDTHYVQGRTAAGGWSQQRYARRRGNQLTAAQQKTAEVAARVLGNHHLDALVVGGDLKSIAAVLQDHQLTAVIPLPRRTFADIAEPRRAVLDEVATQSLDLTITVRDPDRSGADQF